FDAVAQISDLPVEIAACIFAGSIDQLPERGSVHGHSGATGGRIGFGHLARRQRSFASPPNQTAFFLNSNSAAGVSQPTRCAVFVRCETARRSSIVLRLENLTAGRLKAELQRSRNSSG